MLRFSIRYPPQLRLTFIKGSFAIPLRSVAAAPSFGGMEKYSSSSLRTMMACFDRRGFCDVAGPKSDDGDPSNRCC